MAHRRRHAAHPARAGYSFLELSVSVTLFVVVLLSSLALLEHDTQLSRSTLGIASVETMAQEMLFDIERELSNAQGENPEAILTASVLPGIVSSIAVDSTLGFPDSGVLLLDRGKPNEERIAYDSLGADQESFLGITRAEQCTSNALHLGGGELIWAGLAEPIINPSPGVPPPPHNYDCLLYTSPSPRDGLLSRMPSSA